jgi:hypothetical protein
MSKEAETSDNPVEAQVVCGDCDRAIEVCWFCQDPQCDQAICDRCIRTALHESVKLPHIHGG